MATQLFLLDTVADTHLGTNNNNLIPTAVGWTSRALGTARGSGVVASTATATVTGTTLGVVVQVGGVAAEWISPPVSADVTISGTITCNIWAAESDMNANVAINAVVDVIRANATATANSNTIDQIVKTARVTEVAITTRAVNNFTATPTSTTVNRGDRIRVRLFGDDVGTMATAFTFNASYNGTTAAADGDTYVTFTENITFENAPGVLSQTDTSSQSVFGFSTAGEQTAQSFTATGTLTEVRIWLDKVGTPTNNVILEIQTDSGGVPSGSVVGTVATVAGTTLTTTPVQKIYSVSIALSAATTYWLVARVDATLSTINYYELRASADGAHAGWVEYYTLNTGAWIPGSGTDRAWAITLTMATSASQTLYLTDTASDVATASVDREAWTSRGAGVQTDVTNTSAGWVTPIQVTDTAGGTVVDWFTKQLQAFTLTGLAVANIRALESNALGNASLRCQIARVNADGTSPTVWADWCIAPTGTDNGELTTSEVARTCNVSGDDLAFTDGQRIRIRLYADDISSAAMGASQTVTTYYAGTSAAASGDTYITLAQSVTEYVAATAGSSFQTRRQRRASRYLTFR